MVNLDIMSFARKLTPSVVKRAFNYVANYKSNILASILSDSVISEFLDVEAHDIQITYKMNRAWLNTSSRKIESVNIFVFPFGRNPTAGARQIIEFARFLRMKGKDIHFTVLTRSAQDIHVLQNILALNGLGDSKVHVIGKVTDLNLLPCTSLSVATYWITAYPVLKFHEVDAKLYFIQDEESLFYPASVNYYFAELTYTFNFIGITNTENIKEWYEKNHGMPCFLVPPSFLRTSKRKDPYSVGEMKTVLAYFRYAPRNAPDLVYLSAKELKRRHPELEIILAGGQVHDKDITSLGWVDVATVLKLYEKSDVCLYFMFNLHPGLIPLECMSAGTVVITNQKPGQHPYLKNYFNAIIVSPITESVVSAVELLMNNVELRRTIIINGYQTVKEQMQRARIIWENFYENLVRI